MKIAFLAPYSKEHCYREWGVSDPSPAGKDVWFFKHIPDRSIEVDIVGCSASLTYRRRIPLVVAQILGFVRSQSSYDVVISSGFLNGIILSALRKLCPFVRGPSHVILDTQAATFLQGAGPMKIRLTRFLLSPVDGVVCLSRSEQLLWEEKLGFFGRVVYAPFAIDADVQPKSLGTGHHIFSCGATSRDWPLLLSAVKDLVAKVVVVARPDWTTGERRLQGARVPGNTEVLLDIPYDQYKELLADSLFVVVPLKSVPFTAGLTVITQAMALGKAVIATENPSLLDYIVDGETGLFTPPGDAGALADKIHFLLDNPSEAERIGLNSREAMETHLGEKAMAEAIWSLLQRFQVHAPGVSRRESRTV